MVLGLTFLTSNEIKPINVTSIEIDTKICALNLINYRNNQVQNYAYFNIHRPRVKDS